MSIAPPVLLKWGGSLITDKREPGVLRPAVLRRLAAELAAVWHPERLPVVLGHGGGSFGHAEAASDRVAEGLIGGSSALGASRTHGAMRVLSAHVADALRAEGLPVFVLSPSAWLVTAAKATTATACEPVALALRAGLLPVVHGDVVLDRERGFAIASTEQAHLALAEGLPAHGFTPSRAVWMGETDGLLGPDGAAVPEVHQSGVEELEHLLGETRGQDVTGGIRLRLSSCFDLAARGISSRLANGLVDGEQTRALRDEASARATRIPAG